MNFLSKLSFLHFDLVASTFKKKVGDKIYNFSKKYNLYFFNLEKKHLVDSTMVYRSAEGWIELNLHRVMKSWLSAQRRNKNKNFGLLVEVEDESNKLLNAEQFFAGVSCDATEPVDEKGKYFLIRVA